MKKIIMLFLISISLISCSKFNSNPFEGSEWTRKSGTSVVDVNFSTNSFCSTVKKASNSEIVSSNFGKYTVSDGVADMTFNVSVFAKHQATIKGNSLILKNMSSNKTFEYKRK